MKSTLKIAFTGPNNEPVIRVEKRSSDDMRDIMVSQFFEKLQGDSVLCRVQCVGDSADGSSWEISPLSPVTDVILYDGTNAGAVMAVVKGEDKNSAIKVVSQNENGSFSWCSPSKITGGVPYNNYCMYKGDGLIKIKDDVFLFRTISDKAVIAADSIAPLPNS